jgi:hypothetical protein
MVTHCYVHSTVGFVPIYDHNTQPISAKMNNCEQQPLLANSTFLFRYTCVGLVISICRYMSLKLSVTFNMHLTDRERTHGAMIAQ